jgi:uracil-DNA glycosylase
MFTQSSLPEDWANLLKDEFDKPYLQEIGQFLNSELKSNKLIYPPLKNIFQSLHETSVAELKVIILGQDPYHSVDKVSQLPHAHGLSFSIPKPAKKIPPSLKNIFKELQSDLGETYSIPTHGNLTKWSNQGVLLLNSTLTVQAHQANSHSKIGWQKFTDKIIQKISQTTDQKVFILWGNYARSKKALIDTKKHLVLESPHPSPFSAHKGFFGSKPFTKTNHYLHKTKQKIIDWQS